MNVSKSIFYKYEYVMNILQLTAFKSKVFFSIFLPFFAEDKKPNILNFDKNIIMTFHDKIPCKAV